jgi:hypothetical protein
VTDAIIHFARWLAYQLADPLPADVEHPARITVFSSGSD